MCEGRRIATLYLDTFAVIVGQLKLEPVAHVQLKREQNSLARLIPLVQNSLCTTQELVN